MIKHFRSKQFIAFMVTGGIAALINFISRIFFNQWVSFSIAIILAYLTGMAAAFILAKIFVFKNGNLPLHHSAFYFIMVNIVAVAQTWVITLGLANYIFPALNIYSCSHDIAHAIGIVVPVFTSYLGHKYFSFKEH